LKDAQACAVIQRQARASLRVTMPFSESCFAKTGAVNFGVPNGAREEPKLLQAIVI